VRLESESRAHGEPAQRSCREERGKKTPELVKGFAGIKGGALA
jgi:hypothetical protein